MSARLKAPVRVFKALADPTRLRLVLLLLEGDLCVCELTAVLRMEQSRISHQLRILRRAGLAAARRRGRWIIYSLAAGVRRDLRPLLEGLIDAVPGPAAARAADRERLKLCLSRSVRNIHPPSAPAPRRPRNP